MLEVHLKIITSISLLVIITGLFQIHLAVSPQINSREVQDKTGRPKAVIDYRYFRGGFFLIICACLALYFVLLFNFA
jgi:hypothetical protein